MEVLIFADRKHRGRFPVRDGDSRLIAEISTSWTGMSFTALDAAGHHLCAGSAHRLGLSGWRATGPHGADLLSLTKSFRRAQAEVRLTRGGVFVLGGSTWRRDFTVTRADGRTVLALAPPPSARVAGAADFAVHEFEEGLDLAETVALVQIWRMVRNGEDAPVSVATGAQRAPIPCPGSTSSVSPKPSWPAPQCLPEGGQSAVTRPDSAP